MMKTDNRFATTGWICIMFGSLCFIPLFLPAHRDPATGLKTQAIEGPGGIMLVELAHEHRWKIASVGVAAVVLGAAMNGVGMLFDRRENKKRIRTTESNATLG